MAEPEEAGWPMWFVAWKWLQDWHKQPVEAYDERKALSPYCQADGFVTGDAYDVRPR